MERYKDIKGYEGKYQITTWGRVWSIDSEKFLSLNPNEKGYLRVDLVDGSGKKKHHRVHRLVAEAFIDNVYGKPQVNHIDGNKQNNSITNLEWVSDEENKHHANYLRELANEQDD